MPSALAEEGSHPRYRGYGGPDKANSVLLPAHSPFILDVSTKTPSVPSLRIASTCCGSFLIRECDRDVSDGRLSQPQLKSSSRRLYQRWIQFDPAPEL